MNVTGLSFYSADEQLGRMVGSVVVVTGACRSGKTTIGNLLGSCEHVEHIDEPWLLLMLPVLSAHGILPEKFAAQMFRSYTVELLYDRILMRHVNFRPRDLSSVWKQKFPEEIFSRLMGLYSRDDVRHYVQERRITLVLNLADAVPFCDFLWKALPGCRIVHVVREGLDVALDVAEKEWLSNEEHLRPIHANPYREYTHRDGGDNFHLPHWVEAGQEERYLKLSQYVRGLYYWRRVIEMSGAGSESQESGKEVRMVQFSDLIDRPEQTIDALTLWLGLDKTELTQRLLAEIKRPPDREPPIDPTNELDMAELAAAHRVYQRLGMPTEKIDRILVGATRA